MKHTLLYIATLCLLLAACQQEELPQDAQALGYLSLSAVEVEAGDVQLISTRAEDTEDLIIALTPEGGTAKEYEYAETISCPPGSYTLEIYNQAYKDEADAAQYYYKRTESVVITEGETNDDVEPISVPMINFGVQLKLPEGFDEWFPTYTFTVNGKELQEGETAYFDYSSDVKIEYTLTATNTDDEPPFSKKGSNADDCWEGKTIAAGTIYVITYDWETRSLEVE